MKTIAIVLTSILVLSAAVLSFDSARSVSACPSTNSAKLLSSYVHVYPDDTFVVIVNCSWKTTKAPFLGYLEAATGTVGVSDVAITPAYFFPKSCENGLPIMVQGKKTSARAHALNLCGNVAFPNAGDCLPILIP